MEPIFNQDIKLVEGVQRRATKLVQGIGARKYDDRLQYLGLSRLDKRRARDLVETFKIINGVYDVNSEYFFEFDAGERKGHYQKLFKKRFRLDLRKMHLVTELLTIGICSLHNVLTPAR